MKEKKFYAIVLSAFIGIIAIAATILILGGRPALPVEKDGLLVDNYRKSHYEYSFDVYDNAWLLGFKEGRELKEVVVPDVVEMGGTTYPITIVGFDAFTNLDSIVLSDTLVEIYNRAFTHSKTPTLTIPKNVKEIGDYAFEHLETESVIIESGVETIGKGAFEHSTIGELDLQEGLVAIEESAFAYSTLGFVVIPRSIVYVKSHAFAYNENMNGAMIPHNISNAEDILHGTMTDNRFVLSYH